MKAIVLIAVLVACGQDEKQEQGNNSAETTPINKTTEASHDPLASLYVKDASKLAQCEEKTEGQLVYIGDEKAFKYCNAGQWTAIDIKGEKGDKGEQIATEVIREVEKPLLGTNETGWVDPINGYTWKYFEHSFGVPLKTNGATICRNGWKLPTMAEVRDARTKGFYEYINTHGERFMNIWVQMNPALFFVYNFATNNPNDGIYNFASQGQVNSPVWCYHE